MSIDTFRCDAKKIFYSRHFSIHVEKPAPEVRYKTAQFHNFPIFILLHLLLQLY
jgi:hypothetical protein